MNKEYIMKTEVGDWSRWLRMGRDDFSSAKINFDNRKYYVCSYLCHQCVEKSLKALMVKKNKKLIKTHDLVYLAKKPQICACFYYQIMIKLAIKENSYENC